MRLIVHGGAAAWNYYNHDDVLQAMHAAVAVGWAMLCNGGSALDAVEAATVVLEDHPIFDAGTGSHLNDRGEVEMDALITDGWQRDFGAVAGLRHIKNPIKLARVIMSHTRHRFFIANGAEALAEELGIPLVPNMSLVTDAELAIFRKMLARTETEPHPDLGTVGAVALDRDGHLASATSTGGSPFKKQGRVGDVPIYGAGGYSDDRFGGASTTGVGENIMRHLLSKMAVDLMEEGLSANDAATQAVQQVAREIPSPEVGLIVIDAQGRLGAAHTTAHMAVAWIDTDGEPHASMTGPYDFT
jgi:beta-aspartyl-peptidase (threonine type)